MPIDVTMPRLTDDMEQGTIVRWLKARGQEVRPGEALVEVETEKANVEVEAVDGGTLVEILVAEGATAAVGAVIAVLGSAAEAARVPSAQETPASGEGEPGTGVGQAATPSQLARPTAAEGAASAVPQQRASPVARRLAEQAGVDLAAVAGSGPGGRIVERDVATAIERSTEPRAAPEGSRPVEEPRAAGEVAAVGNVRPASRMRVAIARRMSEAKRDIPHFYVGATADMGECVRLRDSIRRRGALPGLTLTHLIVRAMVLPIALHPRVNASWRDDGSIEFHDEVNLGIAVAVEDGLIVPVLHGAGRMTLAAIADGVRALTEKARNGTFAGNELAGSTISLSNVGMVDVDELTAVVNPPHAVVLAVAAVKDRPVVRGGQLAVAKTVRLTLSCDHRVLNGMEGARYLEDVKRALEDPVSLLLD